MPRLTDRPRGAPEGGTMLRISGRNLDIGEALRDQIETRMSASLGRYYDGGYDGHVTVGRDGTGFRTDCYVHLASGAVMRATGHAYDAHESFAIAAEHIEKRLRRYKRWLRDYVETPAEQANAAPYTVLESPSDDDVKDGGFHPAVVAETTKTLKRQSVSDAVIELDLTGAAFVVFRHGGSGRVNVVYRRNDGHIGWIDPPAGDAASPI